MKSFEDWYFELFESGNGSSLNQQEIAEEAWDFRQAEVDELRKNFNNALKTIEIQQRFLDDADGANEIATSRVGELQNKIDEALKLLNLAYPGSWAYCVDEAINILKGNKDEN